jgi:NAD(P)-dependent dehydrogenase (short-subunit alcohol dehydrogenase family)
VVHDIFDVKGKVVVVTGGSRGLGRGFVQGFAEAGADVAIVSRKLETCQKVAREIEQLGVRAFPFSFHVGDWDDCKRMVDAVYDHFGRIDVLINNAGMSPPYPSLEDISEELYDKVMAVNLKGPYRLCTLVGSRMAREGGGRIINISSTAAMGASVEALPYGGAKAGLNNITSGFAAAFKGKVAVNCIMVGPFATDVAEHWADPPDHDNPGWTKAGLRVGLPREALGAALYLASDAASYTNGIVIRVDGGPMRLKRDV